MTAKQRMRFLFRLLIIIMLNICMIGLVQNALIWKEPSTQALSKYGSQGSEVRQIQQKLNALGFWAGEVDGIFGKQTQKAVRQFQQSRGLTVDGIAGPATLRALGIGSYNSYGLSSSQIRQLQQKLNTLGFWSGTPDGIYGPQTESAVRQYQASRGLTVDGIAGPVTLRSLGLSGGTSSGSTGGVSNSDYQLLARIISAEARGEPYTGQVAVGAVVLNRVEHPSFPDSIAGVIYQPGAFSAINDGQINQPVADSCYRAAQEALNGYDPSGGAIYYYNPAKTSNQWIRTRPVITRIGAHLFCA